MFGRRWRAGACGRWYSEYAQVLLRFNTFFKVTALLHAEADKKRVLHELAACAPAVPDGPCRVPQCSAVQQCSLESERSGVN